MNIDQKLTCVIHDASRKSDVVDFLAIFFARDFPFVIVGIPVSFIFLTEGFIEGFLVSLSILVAILVQFMAQKYIKRARPFQKEHLKPLFSVRIKTQSFPSGHATMLGAVLLPMVVSPELFPLIILWFVLIGSFLVLLSRIYAGLHYVSDILMGLILGMFTVFIFNALIRLF